MRASQITPEPISWLWYPYVPLGKITQVAGAPGQAKSLLATWLAAEVSAGRLDSREPATAVILSAEDDPTDTIVPRLIAAGADLDRVVLPPDVKLDFDVLGKLCAQEPVRLVVVDPTTAYMERATDAHKAQHVRAWGEPLRKLAAEYGVAVVLITHTNRRESSDPLNRIGDSIALAQLARSVLIWGADPGDPEGEAGTLKAMTRAKTNLAPPSPSATFRIETRDVTPEITAPVLARLADRQISATDVLRSPEDRTALQEAVEFLRDELAGGPLEVEEIKRRAGEAGIKWRTLQRAKRPAGVESQNERANDKIKVWEWSLRAAGEE